MVKQLYQSDGIDIDAANGRIGPALASASYGGHKDIVLFLLENGANPNIIDNNGTTPLMNAVIGEKPEIVRILLEHGADLTLPRLPITKDKDGNTATAMTFAKLKQNSEIIDLLAKWDADHQK